MQTCTKKYTVENILYSDTNCNKKGRINTYMFLNTRGPQYPNSVNARLMCGLSVISIRAHYVFSLKYF